MNKRGWWNSGTLRKVQLHKGHEEKNRSEHKGRQNRALGGKNLSFKNIYEPKKKVVNKNIWNSIDSTVKMNAGTKDCESTPNPEGQGEALPATDRETCSRPSYSVKILGCMNN